MDPGRHGRARKTPKVWVLHAVLCDVTKPVVLSRPPLWKTQLCASHTLTGTCEFGPRT